MSAFWWRCRCCWLRSWWYTSASVLVVKQFLERDLIPSSASTRFEAAIASAFRLRNSVLVEVLLIAFVYGVGVLLIWRHYTALATATWYAVPTGEGSKLSLSGVWYGYVSLPLFQFLLMRWYLRIFIWARFLWQCHAST